MARGVHAGIGVYGRILRDIREAKGRTQADVARTVGISPAQLARLESNQRGLYLEDFISIAEALGERPGNLLPNDVGDIARLKPLIDRLSTVKPEFLARVTTIVGKIVLLTEDISVTSRLPQKQNGRRQSSAAKKRR